MKAIPLIACLALAAAQGRAQNAPPADGAAPSRTAAPLDNIAQRSQIYGDIKALRALTSLAPAMKQRVDEIDVNLRSTTLKDDWDKAAAELKKMRAELAAGNQNREQTIARIVNNDFQQSQVAQLESFSARTASDLSLAKTGTKFYDQTGNAPVRDASPAPGSADSAADGGVAAIQTGAAAGTHAAASVINAQTPPIRLDDKMTPAPAETPSPSFDYTGIAPAVIKKLQTMADGIHEIAGHCYAAVQVMLVTIHVLSWDDVHSDLPSGAAYKIIPALENNPKLLDKLHLGPFDLMTIVAPKTGEDIPERTIFVYDQKCERKDQKYGHIEYTLHSDKYRIISPLAFYNVKRPPAIGATPYRPPFNKDTDVLACSDGCRIRPVAYFQDFYARGCMKAYAPVTERPAAAAPPPTGY
ncbi:MAG: hypothetical protein ACHQ49_14805 [Elusimicrobiota bacterium]